MPQMPSNKNVIQDLGMCIHSYLFIFFSHFQMDLGNEKHVQISNEIKSSKIHNLSFSTTEIKHIYLH